MRSLIRTNNIIVVVLLLSLICVFMERNENTDVKDRIISACDQMLSHEGECDMDLSVVFADYEWDMVSIFVGGNSKQIKEELGIDNDISDGIVFSKYTRPILLEMSTYDFIHNKSPQIGFFVERMRLDDPYYISRDRSNAIVRVEKFRGYDGKYKYLVRFC